MKKIVLLLALAFLGIGAIAQSSKLAPGDNFTNATRDTLFVVPMERVRDFLTNEVKQEIALQKLELYRKRICLFEERVALADSAMTIKKLEASYWHDQLLQNDQQLEKQQLENLQLMDDKNRIRQSRIYYLVAGLVAGAVLVSL